MTRLTKSCAVPGCRARLHSRYASYPTEVCAKHRHAPGYCACAACGGPVRGRPGAGRSDVRVAMVVKSGSSSFDVTKVGVSLRREPWF